MINLLEFLDDPLGIERQANARARQRRQWQMANELLTPAALALSQGNTDLASATALVGLLALKLSDS